MEFKRKGFLRSFIIENTEYFFINNALEFHYFYKNNKSDVGAWSGKSNLRKKGQDLPFNHILSVKDAFDQIGRIKKSFDQIAEEDKTDSRYQYGIVIDFKNHTIYYDHIEAVRRYFKNRFWVLDVLVKTKERKKWI